MHEKNNEGDNPTATHDSKHFIAPTVPRCTKMGGQLKFGTLAEQEKAHKHDVYFYQTVTNAIAIQQAGRDLDIDLPLHCYMKDKWQLDEWIEQQSK